MKKTDSFWDNVYSETSNQVQSPFTKVMHDKIISLFPEGTSSILDAGCGAGALLTTLDKEKKWDLTGIDLSEQGINYIKNNLNLNASVGSVTDIDFPDNSFDVVICSEVLEHLHINDIVKALSELQRVAKHAVIITTPYKEDLNYHQVKCNNCKSSFHMAGHIWSPDELFFENLLKDKNYKIYYSGDKEWRSSYFADFFRAIGGNVILMKNLKCHICHNPIENRPHILRDTLFKSYVAFQLLLKSLNIGIKPANIIIKIDKER